MYTHAVVFMPQSRAAMLPVGGVLSAALQWCVLPALRPSVPSFLPPCDKVSQIYRKHRHADSIVQVSNHVLPCPAQLCGSDVAMVSCSSA